jgi:hypothetical protein
MHVAPGLEREIGFNRAIEALLGSPAGELPEVALLGVEPLITALHYGQIATAVVTISYGDETAHASGWWPVQDGYTVTEDPAYLKLKKAVESNGGSISVVTSIFDVPSEDELLARLLSSSNKRMKERVGETFAQSAGRMYFDGEYDAALAQARRASLFPLGSDLLNNIGYIYMTLGQHNDAEETTRQAAVRAAEEKDYKTAALALYNSAVCMLLAHRFSDAVTMFSQARQMLAADPDGSYKLRCLLVPVVDGEVLALKEMWDPELSSAIEAAITTLETVSSPSEVEIRLCQHQ